MIRRAGWLWPIGLLLTACAQSFQPAGQADARGERTDARSLAQLHLALATGYFEYGQYGSALASVQRSLEVDPAWDDAYHLRALIRMKLGQRAEAEQDFLHVLPRRAGDGDLLNNYAWLLCEQGRMGDSMAAFERAAQLLGGKPAAVPLAGAGTCSLNAGRYGTASAYFQRALRHDANNETARTQLARLAQGAAQQKLQPGSAATLPGGSIDD